MEIIAEDNCTGCLACFSVCKVGAIEIRETSKGFYSPHVNNEKCVHCMQCIGTCPENNVREIKYFSPTKTYLAKNSKEVRSYSSSGGIFASLADEVIKLGGVVYGAKYDNKLMVEHGRGDDNDAVRQFCGSKYVQSYIGSTYLWVLDDLKNDKYVYFSGTACQIAGLQRYLMKMNCSTDKLFTQDIICHGVASRRFFADYKATYEKKYRSKIVKFNFRGKPEPGKLQNIIIDFENGKRYISPSTNQDIFYFHFFRNLVLKPSCFGCNYAHVERVADITLGDCYYPKNENIVNDGWGISYVQINTTKGEQLFNLLDNSFEMIETDYSKYTQPNMKKPSIKNLNYEEFWNEYEKNGYRSAIKKYGNGNLLGRIKRFVVAMTNFTKADKIIKPIINR